MTIYFWVSIALSTLAIAISCASIHNTCYGKAVYSIKNQEEIECNDRMFCGNVHDCPHIKEQVPGGKAAAIQWVERKGCPAWKACDDFRGLK